MSTMPRYIFIVGLPRTGSKLMLNVLSGVEGEEYRATPENFFLGRSFLPGVRRKLPRYGDLQVDANVEKLVDDMFNGTFHGEFWDKLANGRLSVSKERLHRQLLSTDRSERALYETILHCHAQDAQNVIFGDKTGPHLYHVPTLLAWFPEARVIHTFRDPRAILASEHKKRTQQWQRRATKCAEDGQRLKATAMRLSQPVISLLIVLYITMAWLRAARLHYRYKSRYPKQYALSQFEEMVAAPEESVRALCDFLELPFAEAMLNPPRVDSSFDRSVSEGFDVQTLTRWQQTLQPWMQKWLGFWGSRYLKKFNYS